MISASADAARALHPIGSIELRGVTYAFPPKEGVAPFVLDPIDLAIQGDELLFIVGENGSGKTILIKLLLDLYAAQQGSSAYRRHRNVD